MTPGKGTSRRDYLKLMAAGAGLAATAPASWAQEAVKKTVTADPQAPPPDHDRRIQWWQEAKFGMFIHWGLYSVIGRHEWAMEMEGIPIPQYEMLAKHFNPKPNAARAWAKLARQAGQKYMVMTTKHHEGFCNFDTRLTDYCAPKQAAGRDLVREFVEAARGEGLRVGFYYSLMDWHHPDGALCATDESARKRFVAYTHGLIRELMSNYGKIDILWYDVDWPLSAEQWESEKMNQMVFELQPDIIVNNRNGLPGDFSTPEQHIQAAAKGRAWEACMTLNDSWGYHKADDDWKTPKTIVNNLITCAHGGGNYLLNIGPKPDGSIPEESVAILQAVGKWTGPNATAIYGSERSNFNQHVYANFTQRGNMVYAHIDDWPGDTPAEQWLSFYQPPSVISFGGFRTKVKSVQLLAGGKPVTFMQDDLSLRLTGLPAVAPDQPATVIVIECEAEPAMDRDYVRKNRPRFKAGVS
jgi:alpha-L-fucosidase